MVARFLETSLWVASKKVSEPVCYSTNLKPIIILTFNLWTLTFKRFDVFLLQLMTIAITALTQISNLMVTLNSSVNFIIYCIYGEKFKRLFCAIFCSRCGGARRENLVRILDRLTSDKKISSLFFARMSFWLFILLRGQLNNTWHSFGTSDLPSPCDISLNSCF